MKSTDLLETAFYIAHNIKDEAGAGERICRLIFQFLKDNATPNANKDVSPWECVAKDKLHPVMACLYHDEEAQCAVGCDGHIMLISPQHYSDVYAGKPVTREGEIKDERYPAWRTVIPAEKDCEDAGVPDANTANDMLAAIKAHIRQRKALTKKRHTLQDYYIKVRGDHGGDWWVLAAYFALMTRFSNTGWMRQKGQPERGMRSGTLVCRRQDGAIMLVMPHLASDTAEEIHPGVYTSQTP